MKGSFHISPLGDRAIILSVSYDDTSTCVRIVQDLTDKLRNLPGLASIRPGLDSVLLEYTNVPDVVTLNQQLDNLEFSPAQQKQLFSEIVRIPICYEKEFGIDLQEVSTSTGLAPEEVIQLHTSSTYTVWMIGFMPGFPYLGELPKKLQLPRKASPVAHIPSGSVAVAEEYVGVYPFDSPGGWHVLGRTPYTLFDYRRTQPSLFQYGMRVEFFSISKEEFESLRQQ